MCRIIRCAATGLLTIGILAPIVLAGKNKGTSGKQPPPPPNAVHGNAYGYFIDVDIAGTPYVAGPRPLVELPSNGGTATETEVSVQEDGLFESPTIMVFTSGDLGPTEASAHSVAVISDLSTLAGLLTVEQVVAFSTSTGNGAVATSVDDGTEFVGVTIAGVSLGNLAPPPNSAIPLPGVGVILLNEQITGGDGIKTTLLSVNSIHIVLDSALQDSELLEELIDTGIIDQSLISELLKSVRVDSGLLGLLQDLDIVTGGVGGLLTIGQLNNLLGIDIVDELLDQDALDQLLDEELPGGILNVDVLQALLESGELDSALTAALEEIGIVEIGDVDTTLITQLIASEVLSFELLQEFIENSELDFGAMDGELSEAWAHSGVDFYAASKAQKGDGQKIHGVGKLGSGADQAQFALQVQLPAKKKQAVQGHLDYYDSAAGLRIQSKTLTSAVIDATTKSVTFTGLAQVNGAGSYEFTATARDVAHNGAGSDTFSISLNGPSGTYQRSGTLSAGDLHLHTGK
jgi:hypothetical protein